MCTVSQKSAGVLNLIVVYASGPLPYIIQSLHTGARMLLFASALSPRSNHVLQHVLLPIF